MRSIAKQIDGPTIAAEVRMERQTHKGAFLLVEGATDIKRFERVVSEGPCSFVNCFGKPNAKEAIERLYDDGFPGVLGMIDADFDRLLSREIDHEGIVVSGTHDFDLDAATTSMFERYLNEVADQSKIAAAGGARDLMANLLMAIKPLTAMRFANEKHQLGYSLSKLGIEEFFDGRAVNVDAMVDAVSWGAFSGAAEKAALKAHIAHYAGSNIDLQQATCGHDFCAALGIALRDVAGARRPPQTWQSEVEMHFRLAFDLGHFRETHAYVAVTSWEGENAPYRILREA
jgi:hypothetical protein